jgi:hypothetical protein
LRCCSAMARSRATLAASSLEVAVKANNDARDALDAAAEAYARACAAPFETAESPADGWGEVYTHFDRARGTPTSLEMRNFDRTSDACVRLGWVQADDLGIRLTDKGCAALHDAGRGHLLPPEGR